MTKLGELLGTMADKLVQDSLVLTSVMFTASILIQIMVLLQKQEILPAINSSSFLVLIMKEMLLVV